MSSSSPEDPTPTSSEDRRSEVRLSPGDVGCSILGAKIVHVLGLSQGGHGMRVMTDQPLPQDQDLSIALDLDGSSVSVVGRVVWEKDEDLLFTHRHISGIRFLEAEHDSCKRIHAFVEARLAAEDGARSSG